MKYLRKVDLQQWLELKLPWQPFCAHFAKASSLGCYCKTSCQTMQTKMRVRRGCRKRPSSKITRSFWSSSYALCCSISSLRQKSAAAWKWWGMLRCILSSLSTQALLPLLVWWMPSLSSSSKLSTYGTFQISLVVIRVSWCSTSSLSESWPNSTTTSLRFTATLISRPSATQDSVSNSRTPCSQNENCLLLKN